MKKKVIIIGGGIVGSTAAFYLSQNSDYSIILIDKGVGTATRAAAGIICPWLSQRRNKHWYGLTAQGANFYQKLVQDLEKAGIANPPYHQTGTLVFKNRPHLLEKLYQLACQRRETAPMIGQLTVLQSSELKTIIPELDTNHGAVLTAGGGRVDGSVLVDDLQKSFQENGGQLIRGEAHLLPDQSVSIHHQVLQYDQLILASGAWLPQLLQPLGYTVDIQPQKGQLFEIDTHYQTDDWPGCMLHGEIDILPFENGRLVIGATHENDQGYNLEINPQRIKEMKTAACQAMPTLKEWDISKTRVGIRAYTSDFLPFYGYLPDIPNIWLASGLGSSGLTSGPFIGWQIAQEIQGHETNFDRTPFSPSPYITSK